MVSEKSSSNGKVRKLRLLVVGAGICLFLGQLTPWFGDLHWGVELVSHFQIQFLFTAAFLLILGLVTKVRRELPFLVLPCLLGLFHVSSYWLGTTVPEADPSAEVSLKVVSYNVLSSNENYDEAIDFILSQEADVIALYEVNTAWKNAIDRRLSDLQGPMQEREDNFGISLLSRWPIEILHYETPNPGGVPLIHAQISPPSGTVEVIACHPIPPGTAENLRDRDRFIGRAAELAAAAKDPVIMVGDFNLTRWSPAYGRLLNRSGLANCRDGRGLRTTWFPRTIPLGFLPGLEIDHAFVGPDFSVQSYTVGPQNGSDHSPLVLELVR